VPGHWEGDLLLGVHGASAIVTLVERSSRFVMLGHLPDTRDSSSVMSILSTLAERLPAQLVRSLTWDCGTEMAKHRTFTVASNCPVYFADPHSPWQRGSNETPTACCVSTSRRAEPISNSPPNSSSTRSRPS